MEDLRNFSQFAERFSFLYTFDFMNPWCMSLEIRMNNAISLFYALQILSNIILIARLSDGYPSYVALLL